MLRGERERVCVCLPTFPFLRGGVNSSLPSNAFADPPPTCPWPVVRRLWLKQEAALRKRKEDERRRQEEGERRKREDLRRSKAEEERPGPLRLLGMVLSLESCGAESGHSPPLIFLGGGLVAAKSSGSSQARTGHRASVRTRRNSGWSAHLQSPCHWLTKVQETAPRKGQQHGGRGGGRVRW